MKQIPSAILTADWHLRATTPVCRTDDFQQAQRKKLAFLYDLMQKYVHPMLHAGDLFDAWKIPNEFLYDLCTQIPRQIWALPGNHDLPQHSLDLYKKSGLAILQVAGVLNVVLQPREIEFDDFTLYAVPWGENASFTVKKTKKRKVLMLHEMAYTGELPYPGASTSSNAHRILQKYPEFDLIVTGHNHQRFVVSDGNRLLVNPGSLMRTTAAQADHVPAVYAWYAESNTVARIEIPYQKDVVSRAHLIAAEHNDTRMDSFISTLTTGEHVQLSFRQNLERDMAALNTPDAIKKLVREAVDAHT